MMADAAVELAVRDLQISIGGRHVVDGISFDVRRGEVIALVGESGCGKSLTALALAGLLPDAATISGGAIQLGDRDLVRLGERDMQGVRGRDLSIIFQEPTASLDPLATVGSQVAEAWLAHRKGEAGEALRRARDMLDAVGISDPDRRMQQYPFELSGGMCQRVMIAIALICGPRILVADEPTTALDVTIQAQILSLMRRLVDGSQTGIVLITHDMGVVADIADSVAVMYAGRIAEIATADELFRNPAHPYTSLLLASIPKAGIAAKSILTTIEGTVPAVADMGAGCRFAGRCPYADAQCDAQPPLMEMSAGHSVACWHSARFANAQGLSQ